MEETTSNAENVKPTKKGNVPVADVNFGNVVTTVSEKWVANNDLTLKWLTPAQFKANPESYNAVLSLRMQKGTTRPQITQSLKVLNAKIDDAVSYVKVYLTDKYKKENDSSYFPAFGIVYKNNRYFLPADQNKRIEALKLMIEAITTHGFQDKEFGLAFWTATATEYAVLVKQASQMVRFRLQ